jgi:hypothetical protein
MEYNPQKKQTGYIKKVDEKIADLPMEIES